jgi:hypothetical protein
VARSNARAHILREAVHGEGGMKIAGEAQQDERDRTRSVPPSAGLDVKVVLYGIRMRGDAIKVVGHGPCCANAGRTKRQWPQ